MNFTRFAKILYNGKELYIKINSDNTFQKIFPSYFSKNYAISKKKYHLTKNIKFLPPCNPTKIVCVGLNYVDHAEELKMDIPKYPIIFIKPSSCIISNEDFIIYPKMSKRIDYEAELAVVIKKKAKNISKNVVKNYILGFCCFNDVTARDLQKKDLQWTRAKSFDTFGPLGPWIVDKSLDVSNLKIQTFLNGKIVQDSNTKNMIFKFDEVISFISRVMTLYPEDVISLGTPSNVGPMKKNDVVEVYIEKIGTLRNYVV